jgi:hypothetical protein
MDPTTEPTQTTEFVFLRLEEYFPDFFLSLLPTTLWQAIPYALLGLVAAGLTVAWILRTILRYTSADHSWRGRPGPAGRMLWTAFLTSWILFGLWFLLVFFLNDTYPKPPSGAEITSANRTTNSALWIGFIGSIFVLGVAYTIAMYVKDSRSVRWYWAAPLAGLRISVYAILCLVFLLPAVQTYERTEKRSKVLVLLDVSPSVTQTSDEIGSTPGKKMKSRLATVIELLTDDKVAFIKNLLDKNPVAVYRFGTRLDEESQVLNAGDAAWGANEWQAFTAYDFKPFLLRGLSAEGSEAVRNSRPWGENAQGTPEWAAAWLAQPEEAVVPSNMSPEDQAKLKENRSKLEKRIEVARSIALGTNVPDSITAAVNREAANMVQGIIVFSDGRSNLGSDSAYSELRQRATREKIPIFTVAVGEDRQTVSIVITDVQAPDNAPPDEPFKIIVEADGVNLANTETEVYLDLFLPGKDQKVDPADHTLTGKLTFQPGDPPHGQAEFVIDPATLPENLTEDSKDAAIKKRVLKEGAWSARARIPKNPQEAFGEAEHVRERLGIQVIQKPLRVLLVASGPSREYLALKTMLVREVQDSRAELCVLLQNEAGTEGAAVQDVPPERLLSHFPTKLDVEAKNTDPKERFYNLNEYDLIIAFDPDWSEIAKEQADALKRWVQEQGGGFVYVAGPIHTFQLARVEPDSRLSPLLEILPVIPEDIVVIRGQGTPRTPRRLYLKPLEGSDLLKLVEGEDVKDPISGWEKFFTDRDKYEASPDQKVELYPHRGFYSTYPVKEVKTGARVLAELATENFDSQPDIRPWLVVSNPSAGWRTAFMGSGEMYRMFAYDPPTGREYFERFWVKLAKYMAAKRNVKAARGRILLSKEYISGYPVRVQARLLDPGANPYPLGAIDPKFRIIRLSPDGQPEKEFGPFEMTPKQGPGGFDSYYQGQLTPDPKDMPPGENRYRVVIDVPDSAGDTIEGEFMLRQSNPELDNVRPDLTAMIAMASSFEGDAGVAPRIAKPETRDRLAKYLPKEAGATRLAFKLSDRDLVGLIPECMAKEERNLNNRGKAEDLWDKGIPIPQSWTAWFANGPQQLSYVLLTVVGLLAVEWMTRKLLRLA